MSMEEALREQVQGLDHPGGLHTYIGDTHASLCVACTWLHWLQSVLKEWDERQAAHEDTHGHRWGKVEPYHHAFHHANEDALRAVPVGEQQQEVKG